MSYQIYYDRAFIKVNDKFIPVVSSGSNNCWEVSYKGREIPERHWEIINHGCRLKVLFTVDEIKEQAKRYEEISQRQGTCFKSRNKRFEEGEFERWILGGIKNALTIEEYVRYGNTLYISIYAPNEAVMYKTHYFATTEKFLELLGQYENKTSIEVEFENSRHIYRPKKISQSARNRNLDRYYVLQEESDFFVSYFCRFRKYRTVFHGDPKNAQVRAFKTEIEAMQYLDKHKERLGKMKLKPVLIESAA